MIRKAIKPVKLIEIRPIAAQSADAALSELSLRGDHISGISGGFWKSGDYLG